MITYDMKVNIVNKSYDLLVKVAERMSVRFDREVSVSEVITRLNEDQISSLPLGFIPDPVKNEECSWEEYLTW